MHLLLRLGMHRRADSDGSGEGKQLDPVAIAAKSVSYTFYHSRYYAIIVL